MNKHDALSALGLFLGIAVVYPTGAIALRRRRTPLSASAMVVAVLAVLIGTLGASIVLRLLIDGTGLSTVLQGGLIGVLAAAMGLIAMQSPLRKKDDVQ